MMHDVRNDSKDTLEFHIYSKVNLIKFCPDTSTSYDTSSPELECLENLNWRHLRLDEFGCQFNILYDQDICRMILFAVDSHKLVL